MIGPLRLLTLLTTALVLAVAACGGGDETDDSSSTGSASLSSLAEVFADQLDLDSQEPGAFMALDRADTECFAAAALDTIGDQRQTELGFTLDNIPLLFETDWTDAEIDALTQILGTCVDDAATGTEAYMLSLIPQSSRYNDCIVPEIITTLGERYWLEAFRARFSPPRIEMIAYETERQAHLAGEEPPPPPAWFTDLEPVFETCDVPGYGDNAEAEDGEDACGGEPCEDPPHPDDFRGVALQCSRDPYVNRSYYAQEPERFGEWPPDLESACEELGSGTLVAIQLLAYPCPEGPRDVELMFTGERITEATVADACASSPQAEGPTRTDGSDLRSLDQPWDAEAFVSPIAVSQGVRLSRQALAMFDGLLLLVDAHALRVADGEAEMIVGRWCNSSYSAALDAFDGSVLFEGDSLVVCTPGEEYRSAPWRKPLATARIGQDRVALVVGPDGLEYLDIGTLESRTILELDQEEDGVPISASYGDERWVLVLSTPDDDPADPATESLRHIVFVDSAGVAIDMPNNPFPDPDTNAPRAGALSDDGNTLVFSAEHDDGSSSLIYWDLQAGAETNRLFVIEPQTSDGPEHFGRQWVSGIDISGDQILVNLSAANGEAHPSGALIINFDGNQEDLADYDAHVHAAAFLGS